MELTEFNFTKIWRNETTTFTTLSFQAKCQASWRQTNCQRRWQLCKRKPNVIKIYIWQVSLAVVKFELFEKIPLFLWWKIVLWKLTDHPVLHWIFIFPDENVPSSNKNKHEIRSIDQSTCLLWLQLVRGQFSLVGSFRPSNLKTRSADYKCELWLR